MAPGARKFHHLIRRRVPSDSAFRQQRLPAWYPIITAGTVYPYFLLAGFICITCGVILYFTSCTVKEFVYEYTHCVNSEGIECSLLIQNYSGEGVECQCRIPITLEEFKGNVYMYYALNNYYQNHRRYVKSRDDNQLGRNPKPEPAGDCYPFAHGEDHLPIIPCGAIANSLFNDTLSLFHGGMQVPLLRKGIAWPFDKKIKFRNPPGDVKEAFQNYARPLYWSKDLWELDPADEENNGLQNEDLMVWMRPAAFSEFRKLYRRVGHFAHSFKSGLPAGNYTFVVDYRYNVLPFEGEKRMILSTTSYLGGKSSFIGFAYISVGLACLLLSVVLILLHKKFGKIADDDEQPNCDPNHY